MNNRLSAAQRLREKVSSRLEKAKTAVEKAKTPLSRDLRDCRLEELEGRLAHAVGREVELAALAGAPVPSLPPAVTPRAQKAVEAAAERALRSGQRQRAWKEDRTTAKRLAAERKAAEREANRAATKAKQSKKPFERIELLKEYSASLANTRYRAYESLAGAVPNGEAILSDLIREGLAESSQPGGGLVLIRDKAFISAGLPTPNQPEPTPIVVPTPKERAFLMEKFFPAGKSKEARKFQSGAKEWFRRNEVPLSIPKEVMANLQRGTTPEGAATADLSAKAIYRYLAGQVIEGMSRRSAEASLALVGSEIYRQKEEVRDKIAEEVVRQLGSDPFPKEEPFDPLKEAAKISEARVATIEIAISRGASKKALQTLAEARIVSQKDTVTLPPHRYEGLSRGKGWARKGKGNDAEWGERTDNGRYRVGPGRWVVGGNDGFRRKGEDVWVVKHVKVGEETWTVAD